MCGFRELRGVISKVPKENDSDLRWWRRRVGSGETWRVEEVHPHERL